MNEDYQSPTYHELSSQYRLKQSFLKLFVYKILNYKDAVRFQLPQAKLTID